MNTPTTNPARDLRPGLVRDALQLDALLATTARPRMKRDALREG